MNKILDFFRTAIKWIATDGALHFLVSLLLVLILGLFMPLWVAVLLALVVGLSKETFDLAKVGHKNYNWTDGVHDLMCDIAGIVLGAICVAIYLYLK